MENIPNDPYMLLSFVNMKLRDSYSSLEQMCEDLDISENQILSVLDMAGFKYDKDNNVFR